MLIISASILAHILYNLYKLRQRKQDIPKDIHKLWQRKQDIPSIFLSDNIFENRHHCYHFKNGIQVNYQNIMVISGNEF